jgi:NO-binding membrane sensor protein with MHYT domain
MMPMPEVHQFAYGVVNPIAAYVLAFAGSLLGLACAARAQSATHRSHRARWLVIASFAIGGGIWLMHFMAMLGFDVPQSPVRYDIPLTIGSAVIAVLVVGVGMFAVGFGRRSAVKVLLGGLFTGAGVAAMHYTGMAAMRLDGTVSYDDALVAASIVIAVLAATVALWFTLTVRGKLRVLIASAIMGVAVTGMHYTAMAALRIQLYPGTGDVTGINPILLVLPITVVATGALVGLVFSALQAMSEEEFALSVDFERPVPAYPVVPEPMPQPFPQTPRIISSTVTGHRPAR